MSNRASKTQEKSGYSEGLKRNFLKTVLRRKVACFVRGVSFTVMTVYVTRIICTMTIRKKIRTISLLYKGKESFLFTIIPATSDPKINPKRVNSP